MYVRLSLFHKSVISRMKNAHHSKRSLYTDGIYPYPHKFINTIKYPSQHCYRESWHRPVWETQSATAGRWIMRIFWFSFFSHYYCHFYQLDENAAIRARDPSKWTDEELGIPPLTEGSYYDWLETRQPEPLTDAPPVKRREPASPKDAFTSLAQHYREEKEKLAALKD